MSARAFKFFCDDRLRDVGSVALPNGVVLAAVNLPQVNYLVSITAGLLTIAYTAWRWRQGVKNRRD